MASPWAGLDGWWRDRLAQGGTGPEVVCLCRTQRQLQLAHRQGPTRVRVDVTPDGDIDPTSRSARLYRRAHSESGADADSRCITARCRAAHTSKPSNSNSPSNRASSARASATGRSETRSDSNRLTVRRAGRSAGRRDVLELIRHEKVRPDHNRQHVGDLLHRRDAGIRCKWIGWCA